MIKEIQNSLIVAVIVAAGSCGLEADPVAPIEPGLDGIWVATSWTATDKLGAPRFVSDGAGGMREVPRQFETISLGSSSIVTIRVDGTYSRQNIFPRFSHEHGSQVGTFILIGDQITFTPVGELDLPTETVTQSGDAMTLTSTGTQFDFDEDGTLSLQEEATIVKVFRRSN